MHRGKNRGFHTGSGNNGTQTGKPCLIFNCGKLGCCFFTVMQTVFFWSQSHLDPPLTSSKEGPGVQDFLKKGATVKAHTVGATPSLMPVPKLYYA